MLQELRKPDALAAPRCVVIANPASRRLQLFEAALQRQEWQPAVVIPWIDWIERRTMLADVVRPGDCVRIESPGKDFEVERAILRAGVSAAEEDFCAMLGDRQLTDLQYDKGQILCPRQWYLGFTSLLKRLKDELNELSDISVMNDCDEIAVMFDKPATHKTMRLANLPVPAALDETCSYEQLIEEMNRVRISRVFVKLAHGSSASGVVAYQTDGQRHLAWTTVEVSREDGATKLYNTRKLRRLSSQTEIAQLIDALCAHRVHVERWIPKAGIEGMAFDLRVAMIAGEAAHVIARLSKTPITNLHLLNQRRDGEIVQARMGQAAWQRAMQTCVGAMSLFPNSLYAGIDLLIAPDFKRYAILEINAFGDQIPGARHHGLETYDAELAAMTSGSVR